MIAAAADLPLGGLLAWATVVGVDLVTAPQGLLSRPLVAATVAGWLCGDVVAGMSVGVVLELFALDVLPVGASRYPDYGAAAVGAATLAAHTDRWAGLGAGTGLGLALAALGGWSLQWLRHANTRALQGSVSAISRGSEAAIVRLQWLALLRDIARSLVLAGIAIGVAMLARSALSNAESSRWLPVAAVAVGCAVAALTGGAIRSAGRGLRLNLLVAGLVAGTCWALLG
ncbi:MAG TPA: PTS sugar transporter subunit IIC [Gemmatimonadales bacterium]|nr:PTS sugar transporter subunit IIC [Gemmatimonadales bacterium]